MDQIISAQVSSDREADTSEAADRAVGSIRSLSCCDGIGIRNRRLRCGEKGGCTANHSEQNQTMRVIAHGKHRRDRTADNQGKTCNLEAVYGKPPDGLHQHGDEHSE
ncbi:hypothetical protein D3C85_1428120 [compost metagenome]